MPKDAVRGTTREAVIPLRVAKISAAKSKARNIDAMQAKTKTNAATWELKNANKLRPSEKPTNAIHHHVGNALNFHATTTIGTAINNRTNQGH